MNKPRNRWKSLFANDIGIDLGTANTLVYVGGKGIVLNEPSVVAINQKTGRVVAVGKDAQEMLGRTPGHLKAVRPLVSGVISDYEVSEAMLSYFLRTVKKSSKKLVRPRVIVGVPSGVTNVESRAVRDAAKAAGAREVYIIEEPLAAAIGVGLPVHEPVGNMVIDMGGGTTDIAVISLGGIVQSRNVKIAGDTLNDDIIAYVRDTFHILIGERTAEMVKVASGTMMEGDKSIEIPVRGRDLVTGLPHEVFLTDDDVKRAVAGSLDRLLTAVKEVLETTPPEILSDILKRGIVFVGGGALIRGLREAFEEELEVPVYTVSDPLTCVACGTGMVLENLALYKEALIEDDDAFEQVQ